MKFDNLKNVAILGNKEMGTLVGGGDYAQTFKRCTDKKVDYWNSADYEQGYYVMADDKKSAKFRVTNSGGRPDDEKCDAHVPDVIYFETVRKCELLKLV
jgi:hypothetical protein